MKLRISLLTGGQKESGQKQYKNTINSENFKEIAIVLLDLSHFNIPIDKAIKEYSNLKKSDWEATIGI